MTIKSIGLVAALAFVAAACGTKEAPGPLDPTGPTGRVRFVNLINDPARIPVNAILEGLPFGVNLGYGGTTPATLPSPSNATYSPILTGARNLVLKKTADTTLIVGTLSLDIAENTDYTVYATGGVGGATGGVSGAQASAGLPLANTGMPILGGLVALGLTVLGGLGLRKREK